MNFSRPSAFHKTTDQATGSPPAAYDGPGAGYGSGPSQAGSPTQGELLQKPGENQQQQNPRRPIFEELNEPSAVLSVGAPSLYEEEQQPRRPPTFAPPVPPSSHVGPPPLRHPPPPGYAQPKLHHYPPPPLPAPVPNPPPYGCRTRFQQQPRYPPQHQPWQRGPELQQTAPPPKMVKAYYTPEEHLAQLGPLADKNLLQSRTREYFEESIGEFKEIYRETALGMALHDSLIEMTDLKIFDDIKNRFQEKGYREYDEIIMDSFDQAMKQQFIELPIMLDKNYKNEEAVSSAASSNPTKSQTSKRAKEILSKLTPKRNRLVMKCSDFKGLFDEWQFVADDIDVIEVQKGNLYHNSNPPAKPLETPTSSLPEYTNMASLSQMDPFSNMSHGTIPLQGPPPIFEAFNRQSEKWKSEGAIGQRRTNFPQALFLDDDSRLEPSFIDCKTQDFEKQEEAQSMVSMPDHYFSEHQEGTQEKPPEGLEDIEAVDAETFPQVGNAVVKTRISGRNSSDDGHFVQDDQQQLEGGEGGHYEANSPEGPNLKQSPEIIEQAADHSRASRFTLPPQGGRSPLDIGPQQFENCRHESVQFGPGQVPNCPPALSSKSKPPRAPPARIPKLQDKPRAGRFVRERSSSSEYGLDLDMNGPLKLEGLKDKNMLVKLVPTRLLMNKITKPRKLGQRTWVKTGSSLASSSIKD